MTVAAMRIKAYLLFIGSPFLHAAAGMAVGAVDRTQVAEVDRVFELRGGGIGGEDGVADRALLTDLSAVGADVLIVVTTETSLRREMADVIGVRAPVDVHLREAARRENLLQRRHSLIELRLLSLVHIGIGLLVIRRKFIRDRAERLRRRRVVLGQDSDSLLLDVWQRSVDVARRHGPINGAVGRQIDVRG